MKRWVIVLLSMLVCSVGFAETPLMLQDIEYERDIYKTHEMPKDLHEALVNIPKLLLERKQLQEAGHDLSEEKQQALAKYSDRAKGQILVLIGFPTCRPCNSLFNLLDSENTDSLTSVCWLEYWNSRGVNFYMINSEREIQFFNIAVDRLIYVWNVSSVPVLILLQDGLPVLRLNGYNEGQADEVVRKFNLEISRWAFKNRSH